jgi:hypothetical protein
MSLGVFKLPIVVQSCSGWQTSCEQFDSIVDVTILISVLSSKASRMAAVALGGHVLSAYSSPSTRGVGMAFVK